MNKNIKHLAIIFIMLFAIMGCGNNTNTPNSSGVSTGGTSVSLLVDKKKQHTIYSNKTTNLTINHIILSYKKSSDTTWETLTDSDGSNGWNFSLPLEVGASYDFKAEAYNADEKLIYHAIKNSVAINSASTNIPMVLEQEGDVNIETTPFSIIGKSVTPKGDGTFDVVFTLSNPDNVAFKYGVDGDLDAGGTLNNGSGTTITLRGLSSGSHQLYIEINELTSITFTFVLADTTGTITLYAPPTIPDNPMITIDEVTKKISLTFLFDEKVMPSCKLISGGSTIDSFSCTQLLNSSQSVLIGGYYPSSSDFKFKFVAKKIIGGVLTSASKVFHIKKMATSLPITLAELKAKIANNEDVTQVNTSAITDMSKLFYENSTFNQDISGWDVSNVTNMGSMFARATSFNQNIGNWDVSNVTDMGSIFFVASNFNQNIGNWNVSNVTNMHTMFFSTIFNQDIGSWDVSNVIDMGGMFSDSTVFNQDIGSWDVSNVKLMNNMFENVKNFNQDISSWNVSNVTNMFSMFENAKKFNQDIANWDTSNVKVMSKMFAGATIFNQDIGNWDVSNVRNMSGMFWSAEAFNQDISSWNVSNVTDISDMFRDATAFNQDISSWNVSNVKYMSSMFNHAISFNQDIGAWDVSNVHFMRAVFYNASSFSNHNLSSWNVSNVLDHDNFSHGWGSGNTEPNWSN